MEPARKAGMDFAGGGVELCFIVQHHRTGAGWTRRHRVQWEVPGQWLQPCPPRPSPLKVSSFQSIFLTYVEVDFAWSWWALWMCNSHFPPLFQISSFQKGHQKKCCCKLTMLWLAKVDFMARKRSFIVHFQKTRQKVPIAKWSLRLYSVHVFYFSLWNGGRSPYLLGKPISESWVVSDVGDWVLWLFCSLKDLQNAVYKQMGLEMISLPSPTLLNSEVGLCWICKTVSEIQE